MQTKSIVKLPKSNVSQHVTRTANISHLRIERGGQSDLQRPGCRTRANKLRPSFAKRPVSSFGILLARAGPEPEFRGISLIFLWVSCSRSTGIRRVALRRRETVQILWRNGHA